MPFPFQPHKPALHYVSLLHQKCIWTEFIHEWAKTIPLIEWLGENWLSSGRLEQFTFFRPFASPYGISLVWSCSSCKMLHLQSWGHPLCFIRPNCFSKYNFLLFCYFSRLSLLWLPFTPSPSLLAYLAQFVLNGWILGSTCGVMGVLCEIIDCLCRLFLFFVRCTYGLGITWLVFMSISEFARYKRCQSLWLSGEWTQRLFNLSGCRERRNMVSATNLVVEGRLEAQVPTKWCNCLFWASEYQYRLNPICMFIIESL